MPSMLFKFAIAALLGCLCIPSICDADPEHSVDAMLQKLGAPAGAAEVEGLLSRIGKRDIKGAQYAVVALRRAGGPASVTGLLKLMRHRAPAVSLDAIRASAELRLRDPLLLERLRALLDHRDEKLAGAAITALGVLGDGTDVPLLLSLTQAPERSLKKEAFNALRKLSDTVIPNVLARWSWWWKGRRARAKRLVAAAIEAFDEEISFEDEEAAEAHDRELARHEAVLLRDAWIVLPLVREEMRRWLRRSSPAQQVLACQLIARMGLTDLLKAVRSVKRYATHKKVKLASSDCVLQLTGQQG